MIDIVKEVESVKQSFYFFMVWDMRKPKPDSIIEALDTKNLTVISRDDLRNMSAEEADEIRHRAEISKQKKEEAAFICYNCSHPVYAPRTLSRKPYWQHQPGADRYCEWHTGYNLSPYEVGADQFSGNQESAAHSYIKHHVANTLKNDPGWSDVAVEEFQAVYDSQKGKFKKRRPDVSAAKDGKIHVFEIQLARTLLPNIIGRELDYLSSDIELIWLLHEFSPPDYFKDMTTAFRDVYRRHNDNIFSISKWTIDLSEINNKLFFQAYTYLNDSWVSELCSLDDLKYQHDGLPYIFEPPKPWHIEFKEKWINLCDNQLPCYQDRIKLVNELIDKAGLILDQNNLYEEEISNFISTLFSLEIGRPIHSRDKNLVGFTNSFLNRRDQVENIKIFSYMARHFNRNEIFDRWGERIEKALKHQQALKGSPIAKITRTLYPDLPQRSN